MTNEEHKAVWRSPQSISNQLKPIEEERDSNSKIRKSSSSLTSLDDSTSSAVGASLSQLSGSGTGEASDGKRMLGTEKEKNQNLENKLSTVTMAENSTSFFVKEKVAGTSLSSSPLQPSFVDGSKKSPKEADSCENKISVRNPDLTTPAGEVSESACSKVAIVRRLPKENLRATTGTKALDNSIKQQTLTTQQVRTVTSPTEGKLHIEHIEPALKTGTTSFVSTEDRRSNTVAAAQPTESATPTTRTAASSTSSSKEVKFVNSSASTATEATATAQSQPGTTRNTSPGGVNGESGKVQVIRPCPVKTAPHLATAGTIPAVQPAAISAALVTPVPVTANNTAAEGGIQPQQPRAEVNKRVHRQQQQQQLQQQAPLIREQQQIPSKRQQEKLQQQVTSNKQVATNAQQHKQILQQQEQQQQQQAKPSQTTAKKYSSASADEAARRREQQQREREQQLREKEEAKKRKESQCQFPKLNNTNSRGKGMGPQEAVGGPKGQHHHHSQQQRQQYNNRDGGGGNQDQAYHHRSQQQMRPGSSGASGVAANRRQAHGRTISTGSDTMHSSSEREREHASSLSSVPPTPLFERLVSEEVQELKSYARIIETQNRRLADLELVHGDLEARLEVQNKERMALEKTLEERERFWSSQFAIMQKDRDNWKNVVQQEQTKNSRLMDQVVRKDQDIHRMLQRKYDHHRSDRHDHSSIHSSVHHRESLRGGRQGSSASGLDRSNTPPSDRLGGHKVLDHHRSPHEILNASGSTKKVNERNVTTALEDFFAM